jgi:hypothetical protein
MKTIMDLYEWMKADAEKNIQRLEAGDRVVNGTPEEAIAALRDEIRQIEDAIRNARLH